MKFHTRSFAALSFATLVVVAAGCITSNSVPTPVVPDTLAPTVTATTPVDGATSVTLINASFSKPMNASTFTAVTFGVSGPGGTQLAGAISYDAPTQVASFVPTTALVDGSAYVATLTTGVKDLAGNAMVADRVWRFTKGGVVSGNLAPNLGAATGFVILAGSTVTNTGLTTLTGDLGVSPGSAVTGFPPGILNGSQHAADAASAAAMAALTLAYNDAAGRTLAPVTVAGNLGGQTLAPGLYKSTSSLEISSGDLTLDAQGNGNAVFIFQMASTLTTTPARAVILIGGAKASKIFWQVGSSATFGTTSSFQGTVMADQSITLNTGATLSGRALARIGAVSLAGNAAVLPTP